MQHDHLTIPSMEHEPIPLLPAQVRGLRSQHSDIGIWADDMIESPLTVRPTLRASSAIAMMRDASASAALVTQALRGGRYDRVLGLVTARRLEQEVLDRWEPEVGVGDAMYPWEDVSIVNGDSVRSLTAHQVFDMFRGTGLSHVVVVDNAEDPYAHVIGLISRAALAQRVSRLVIGTRPDGQGTEYPTRNPFGVRDSVRLRDRPSSPTRTRDLALTSFPP